MDEYTTMVKHIARLAMTQGWLDYARARAKELEAEKSGTYKGIGEAVRLEIESLKQAKKNGT
jgi:hypothetical protein